MGGVLVPPKFFAFSQVQKLKAARRMIEFHEKYG